LGHVINLGNVDVMSHITKIAAVEKLTAIWEYNPTRTNNHVLGGSLGDCCDLYACNQGKNVSIPEIHIYASNSQCAFRFRRLDNVSNISRVPSFIVDSLKP